tara:strand:- start:393 stop:722 length:330 start_codon:yes stop_codon:yes gene_type:complete
MEVTGKIVEFLDIESGTSKAGKEWQKQSVVIDTGEDFNNIIAVSAFGDKVQKMNMLKKGMTVAILCNVYSREYKGKYYHNIDGYHFTNQSDNAKANSTFVTTEDNDLPF